MRIVYKNTPIILMLLVYLFLGSIYPARRFNFHYAILFKLFYLSLCTLGVCQLMRRKFSQRLFPLGMALFGGVAGISALTSFYSVRAGSELDIIMAAIALSFLFWTYGDQPSLEKLKFLGIAILCLLHFSICLTLACEIYHFPFSYPWMEVARDFLLNVTSIFQFFTLKKVCCPFDYVNYAGYFGVLAFPFFLGLLLAEQKKGMKYLWAYGLLCSFAILYVSQSKAAYYIFIFILACVGALWIYHIRNRILKKLFITTILLGIFAVGSCFMSPRIMYSIQSLYQRNLREFFTQRWYAAQDGFYIAKDKPWFGHGITTTPLHYLESKPTHVHHCWQIHVAPVQFWIEFGFLGGLLWGGLLILILWSALKRLRNKSLPKNYKYAVEGCLLAWVAYLIFNSESSWDIFSISGFICLIGGFLLITPQTFRGKMTCPIRRYP